MDWLTLVKCNEKYAQSDAYKFSILSGLRGSLAHGTYTGNICDVDIIDVCIPTADYYFGLKEFGSRGTVQVIDGMLDGVAYEIRKFVSLLMKGNPSALSLLWLNEDSYFHVATAGRALIDNRSLFSVKTPVYNAFVGYANSQMKKMTSGSAYEGYAGDTRKELFRKFGYDTKNAAHLIRLLRMCEEFMLYGELNVARDDADELKSIKEGNFRLDEVVSQARHLLSAIDQAYVQSSLPDSYDYDAIDSLLIECISSVIS